MSVQFVTDLHPGVLFGDIPRELLLPCFLPCVVTTAAQYLMFRVFRKYQTRERRIEEENVKLTAEVLREIKTVRQFAMEAEETANYARNGLERHEMVQGPFNTREAIARLVWSTLEAGLVFTIWRGFPFLSSGEVSVTDMLDIFCKVNFGYAYVRRVRPTHTHTHTHVPSDMQPGVRSAADPRSADATAALTCRLHPLPPPSPLMQDRVYDEGLDHRPAAGLCPARATRPDLRPARRLTRDRADGRRRLG